MPCSTSFLTKNSCAINQLTINAAVCLKAVGFLGYRWSCLRTLGETMALWIRRSTTGQLQPESWIWIQQGLHLPQHEHATSAVSATGAEAYEREAIHITDQQPIVRVWQFRAIKKCKRCLEMFEPLGVLEEKMHMAHQPRAKQRNCPPAKHVWPFIPSSPNNHLSNFM